MNQAREASRRLVEAWKELRERMKFSDHGKEYQVFSDLRSMVDDGVGVGDDDFKIPKTLKIMDTDILELIRVLAREEVNRALGVDEPITFNGSTDYITIDEPFFKDGWWYKFNKNLGKANVIDHHGKMRMSDWTEMDGKTYSFVTRVTVYQATLDDLSIELAGKQYCVVDERGDGAVLTLMNSKHLHVRYLGSSDVPGLATAIAKKLAAPVICSDQWKELTK